MTDAAASTPNFKTYTEGEPIPPVDPEELKRRWNIKAPWTLEALQAAWSQEADSSAVSSRWAIIDTLIVYKLLTPWQHGNEVDDAVFHIAATFPLRELKHKSCMMPGDEYFGFDLNAFVQQLVDETGISHVWEPVATKVPEGGRLYIHHAGPGPPQQRAIGELWDTFCWGSRDGKEPDPSEGDTVSREEAAGMALLFAQYLTNHYEEYLQLKNDPSLIVRRWAERHIPRP